MLNSLNMQVVANSGLLANCSAKYFGSSGGALIKKLSSLKPHLSLIWHTSLYSSECDSFGRNVSLKLGFRFRFIFRRLWFLSQRLCAPLLFTFFHVFYEYLSHLGCIILFLLNLNTCPWFAVIPVLLLPFNRHSKSLANNSCIHNPTFLIEISVAFEWIHLVASFLLMLILVSYMNRHSRSNLSWLFILLEP